MFFCSSTLKTVVVATALALSISMSSASETCTAIEVACEVACALDIFDEPECGIACVAAEEACNAASSRRRRSSNREYDVINGYIQHSKLCNGELTPRKEEMAKQFCADPKADHSKQSYRRSTSCTAIEVACEVACALDIFDESECGIACVAVEEACNAASSRRRRSSNREYDVINGYIQHSKLCNGELTPRKEEMAKQFCADPQRFAKADHSKQSYRRSTSCTAIEVACEVACALDIFDEPECGIACVAAEEACNAASSRRRRSSNREYDVINGYIQHSKLCNGELTPRKEEMAKQFCADPQRFAKADHSKQRNRRSTSCTAIEVACEAACALDIFDEPECGIACVAAEEACNAASSRRRRSSNREYDVINGYIQHSKLCNGELTPRKEEMAKQFCADPQ
eukprot:Pgem_evm1s20030